MLQNEDRRAFLDDRARNKAESLLGPLRKPGRIGISPAEEANLKRQREKLSKIKGTLKQEIQREKLRNQNLQKYKQRVKDLESKNVKKRRDLLKFFKDMREGNADKVIRQLEGVDEANHVKSRIIDV